MPIRNILRCRRLSRSSNHTALLLAWKSLALVAEAYEDGWETSLVGGSTQSRLFGGQGSPTIFPAGRASTSAKTVKKLAAAATLLSRYHVAFSDELASVNVHIASILPC